jgi:hypothetical protein
LIFWGLCAIRRLVFLKTNNSEDVPVLISKKYYCRKVKKQINSAFSAASSQGKAYGKPQARATRLSYDVETAFALCQCRSCWLYFQYRCGFTQNQATPHSLTSAPLCCSGAKALRSTSYWRGGGRPASCRNLKLKLRLINLLPMHQDCESRTCIPPLLPIGLPGRGLGERRGGTEEPMQTVLLHA